MELPDHVDRIAIVSLAILLVFGYGCSPVGSSIRNIPGPFLAKVTSWYRFFLFWRGEGISLVLQLHQQYGPVVRTGPKHVLVAEPDALFMIYGTTFPKSNFYDVFTLFHGGHPSHTVITTQDNELHRLLRFKVASKFSAKSVLAFEPAVDECIDVFIRSIEQRTNRALNLEQWLQYWTSDVAAKTALGRRIGFMEQDADIRGIIQGLKAGFRYAASIGQVPACHSWLIGNRKLIDFISNFVAIPNPPGEYIEMIENALDCKGEKPGTNEHSILSWLRDEQERTKGDFTREELVNHLFVFVAGGGTVAITLGAILYYLMKSPVTYTNLREEIDRQDRAGLFSTIPTHEQTLELPYLDIVIKEAMRMCPITTLPLERVVPEGGVTIDKHYIPAGIKIGTAAPAVHMNTDIYGEDAAEFNPERWQQASAVQAKRMDKYFFGWSKGSRSCLGKHFAMLQMRKFVVQLLRRFDIEWASDTPVWKLKYFWVTEQHNLKARFLSRLSSNDSS